MKDFKIAVAGAHGVGKTTFSEALSKRLALNYIPDVVRVEAFPKGFEINETTPPEVQAWLTMRQWELERLTTRPWIADKSLLDYRVYGDLVLSDDGVSGEIKQMIKSVIERNGNYDKVFYLPIEFPIEDDGIRSADPKFQSIVDQNYKKFLREKGIKYIVLTGSVEERVNQAIKHLNEV